MFVIARNKKDDRYHGGNDVHPLKKIDYYVPEPPEEDEDHEWIDTGAEFPSDSIGDGPDFHDRHVYARGLRPSSDKRRPRVGCVGKLTEPSEEDEDPQWIQAGPEYSSDYSGDGPDSSE